MAPREHMDGPEEVEVDCPLGKVFIRPIHYDEVQIDMNRHGRGVVIRGVKIVFCFNMKYVDGKWGFAGELYDQYIYRANAYKRPPDTYVAKIREAALNAANNYINTHGFGDLLEAGKARMNNALRDAEEEVNKAAAALHVAKCNQAGASNQYRDEEDKYTALYQGKHHATS